MTKLGELSRQQLFQKLTVLLRTVFLVSVFEIQCLYSNNLRFGMPSYIVPVDYKMFDAYAVN